MTKHDNIIKYFLIVIFLSKIIYNFDFFNPNYFRQNLSDNTFYYQYYFLILKDILLFCFLIISVYKFLNNKFFLKIIFITFLLISSTTLLKIFFFNDLPDMYIVLPFKNILLGMSLIYISEYISFDKFISVLKIIATIAVLVFFFQIFFIYPDMLDLSPTEKLVKLSGWHHSFISGRPIGIFGSPNSMGKFFSILMIFFLVFFFNNHKNNRSINFLMHNRHLQSIFSFIVFSLLAFVIFFSQTLSVIISLSALLLMNFFLNFKLLKINLIKISSLLLSLILLLCVFWLFYPEIIYLYISRIENLFNFILQALSIDFSLFGTSDFTFRKLESVNSGFGTYAERFDDLNILKKCIDDDFFQFVLFGCNTRYDSANLGHINILLNFGLLISALIIYLLSIISFTKLNNNSNFRQKIISLIMRNITIFCIFLSFVSKIFEISVVNYLFFIMLGYFLNEFKVKNK